MIRKILVVSLAFALAACGIQPAVRPTPTPFTGVPRSIIIDTDMAPDDWMAMLYLFQRPDISIKAITVTGTGEAHCGSGVKNALDLAALAGHPDTPVSCGRETPLQGDHAFPADWRTNVDALAGLTLPDNPASPSSQSAVQLLTTTIQSSPDKVTILALGPLTNLAEALQAAPGLKDEIETVYIMGGAVDVPGNVGPSRAGIDNQTAEWNIYVDPHAAGLVFQSGASITLVPLDATNQVPVTTRFFNRLKKERDTPEANFVFDVLTKSYDSVKSGGLYFWDPLAAVILTDNSLATFAAKTLSVVEDEGPDSGRTQETENGILIRVALNADRQQFESVFIDTLNAA